MTTHAQITRILAAGLDLILAPGRTARITLNIGSGGNVRIEVATFRDMPANLDAETQGRRGNAEKKE
ncbi:MAG: hypothetical protein M9936_23450 [Caldilinea sp.]|nr:hypothetical protein [Caldilineaceae bacterium]MCB0147767.1 hypothetical protein [Caldilineaceae bacterium]MCO5212665.1 hypothetical protein [Caldilinea sp.]MCW5845009.1 hypothetical protein [Caldilinea sp.]